MLSNADRRKLRYGRIISADVPNSFGTGSKPHFAVMIDTDEQIQDAIRDESAEGEPNYFIVPISHNTTISPNYLIPVSPRMALDGFTGYFQCGWGAVVSESAIHSFRAHRIRLVLTEVELAPVWKMIRQFQKDKAAEAKKQDGSQG